MIFQNNYYGINNNTYVRKPNRFSYNNPKDIAFGGHSLAKFGAGYAGVSVLLFGLWGAIFAPGIFNSNQKEITKNSEWDNNLKVLASTGQRTIGISATGGTDSYLLALSNKISNGEIKTLEQANDLLAKQGYKIPIPFEFQWKTIIPGFFIKQLYLQNKQFFPLETYGKELGVFNRDDKNKNRFILSLYNSMENRFSKETNTFLEQMKDLYNIPKENIINLAVSSFDNFKDGVDSIVNKIEQLKNKNNVELLILYDGHGDAEALKKGSENIEGSMEGILQTESEIKESQIKRLFHEKLHGIKTLFIIDSCHSGAWIASNTQKNIIKNIKLLA